MAGVDAAEIFALLVKADERMKYAREGDAAAARAARDLLERALEAARAAALPDLVSQVELRFADLPEEPEASPGG